MYSIKDGVVTSQKVTTAATASSGPLTHESRLPSLMVQPGADRAINSLTPQIEAILHTLYPSAEVAPFHNIKHAHETRDAALLLARRAQEHGHVVDLAAIEHAALLHDAHYQISPAMMGMPFREDVHMHFAYNTLRMLGAPDPHAFRVARIILATNSMIEPQSIEEKIMRAADLSKLHGSYEGFLDGSKRLHREGNLLSYGQEPKDFSEFCRGQISYLALYLWPSLDLTPSAGGERGQSRWHEGVLENIFRLYREEVETGGAIVADLSEQPGASGWNTLRDSNAIVVRVHEDQHSREYMLAQMRDVVAAAGSPLIPFVVPGTNERTPIPGGRCSLVCMDAAANDLIRAEAQRIISPSGAIVLS